MRDGLLAAFQVVGRLAEHAHIAAQRQQAELPARAVSVGEAEQLAAEADREDLDPDAAPAGDQEMAELVDEDQRASDRTRNQKPLREISATISMPSFAACSP